MTWQVLLAAPAIYLLIGLAGATSLTTLEGLDPAAVLWPASLAPDYAGRIYFSFMTLTTTGYGDIVPISGLARGWAGMLAAIGIFYPAVVVARLVSLYRADPLPERDGPGGRA